MFEELSWFHFQQLERIKKLPLHEQVSEYDNYLGNLTMNRLVWAEYQNSMDDILLTESGLSLTNESALSYLTVY
jgi:hypothetical protein